MKNKITVLFLAIITTFCFIPVQAVAYKPAAPAVTESSGDPQMRQQRRRGRRSQRRDRDRGRHRGWHRGRRAYVYYYNPYQAGYVRYPYFRSGRRYYMWVRYY